MIPAIIPTYKGQDRLPRVLNCLKTQTWETTAWIRDNNTNGVYYTKAVNEGLRRFCFLPEFEFVLVLCDDVYMDKNCVEQLVMAMRENPKAGIMSPVQYAIGEPYKCNWAGSASSWPWGRHITMVMSEAPYPALWASGAVFMVRTEMVKQIGLMDENMLFICSDADYSMTARSRGWKCMVAPRAKVEHNFGGSVDANDEMTRIKRTDAVYYTQKWLSGDLFRTLEHKGDEITEVEVNRHVRHLCNKMLYPRTV